jgi:hypothetical protein
MKDIEGWKEIGGREGIEGWREIRRQEAEGDEGWKDTGGGSGGSCISS